MMADFNLAAYRALLLAIVDGGYEFRGYEDANHSMRHIVLRHDIDMSLGAALPVAEIEQSLGIKAHYFILARSEMYNLFSARSKSAIRHIISLGHEIGLHFDAGLYVGDFAELDRAAGEECAVLEAATGHAVRSISFHRPAKSLLSHSAKFGGRIHTYQPRYFKEMGYCSDSRGAWRYGHPLEHSAFRDGRALQLLTHPIWWVGDGNIIEKLTRFLSERANLLSSELAANCEPYRDALGIRRQNEN